METTYLVEIRLARTKWRIKKAVFSISHHYGLESHMEKHPHVTIFGPLHLRDTTSEEKLLQVLGHISAQFDPIPFILDGWEKRVGIHGSVIAFPVRPSESLVFLTTAVATALLPLTESLNHWDSFPDKKWFHVTLANRMDDIRAQAVFSGLSRPELFPHHIPARGLTARILHTVAPWFTPCSGSGRPVLFDEDGLRLTVMKGEDILAEYDFLKKEWIFVSHDHKSSAWQETLRTFRLFAGVELTMKTEPRDGEIFVISDLHLGHANIIRYCSRPFHYPDVEEMNRVLIANWNFVVSPKTRVYHIGDFRYGKESLPVHSFQEKLAGMITFIQGNHDDRDLTTVHSQILEYDGMRFFLVHDPADAPQDFNGWVIHGHHHNNDLRHYPFLNIREKRVNVSAEVVGYCPVSLLEICSHIRDHERSGNCDPVLFRYSHL